MPFIDESDLDPVGGTFISESDLDPSTPPSIWDRLTTRPDGTRVSGGQAVAGPLMAVLDGLTFGAGDEIVAGGNAVLDAALQGKPLGEAYDERLKQTRDIQTSLQKASPVGSALLNVAGGVKVPLGAVTRAGDSIPLAAAKLAGAGAAYGGAYGFGEGESGISERLGDAAQGAKVGAIATPILAGGVNLLGRAAKGARDFRVKSEDKLLGARASDFTRSATSKITALDEDGTQTKKALEAIKKEGILDGDITPIAIFQRHQEKAGALGDEINSIVQQADELREGIRVIPKFDRARSLVGRVAFDDRPAVQRLVDAKIREFKAQTDGSIEFIHRQKQLLGKKAYRTGASPTLKAVDRAITSDLRDAVEKATKILTPQNAGKVRELNKRLGAFEETEEIVARLVGADEADSAAKTLIQGIRTSGGGMAPVIAGATSAGAPGAAVGGLMGATAVAANLRAPGYALAKAADQAGKTIGPLANIAERIVTPRAIGALTGAEMQLQRGTARRQEEKRLSGRAGGKSRGQPQQPLPSKQNPSGRPSLFSPIADSPSIFRSTEAVTQEGSEMRRKDVDLDKLVRAVIVQESAGKPDAVSEVGAQGLMQLMPETGREWHKRLGIEDPYDPFDVDQNVRIGSAYLNHLIDQFGGDIPLALTAYHSGQGRVRRLLEETDGRSLEDILPKLGPVGRKYAQGVLEKYRRLDDPVEA